MAKLNMLAAWSGISEFFGKRSAQSYFKADNIAFATSGGCGSACGAGDEDSKKEESKPSACGSACGAGDTEEKPEQKPSACGSACGAGDK